MRRQYSEEERAAYREQQFAEMNGKVQAAPSRLFIDMDGTLARFHDRAGCLEAMVEEGFFETLFPFEETVAGVRGYIADHPEGEVYILSACINTPTCRAEKNAWLDRYLPEIDGAHRLFAEIGADKTACVPGGIRTSDVLLDDYNKNLEQWRDVGGRAVKFVNNINDRGLYGEKWQGARLRYDTPPEVLRIDLAEQLGLNVTAARQSLAEERERIRAERGRMFDDAQRLGSYAEEQQADVSDLLHYIGDYGVYEPKNDVTAEQIRQRMREYGILPEAAGQDIQSTRQPKKQTVPPSGKNFYELEEIKAVPLPLICQQLHIPLEGKGKHPTCKLRDEKTASCTLYPDNSFYDFGSSIGGDNIRFVQEALQCDAYTAIKEIADIGGIAPQRHNTHANTVLPVSDRQYRMIGIAHPEKATANMPIDLERYSEKQTQAFLKPYENLTVQELREQYPGMYAKMMQYRAVPYIYELRNRYYFEVYSAGQLTEAVGTTVGQSPELLQELKELAREVTNAEKVLQSATKELPDFKQPKAATFSPLDDLNAIRSGKLQFEVGSVPYVEFKQSLSADDRRAAFLELPAAEYFRHDHPLRETPHAAFLKGDMVNVAYDRQEHPKLFPDTPLKGKAQEKANPVPEQSKEQPVRGL